MSELLIYDKLEYEPEEEDEEAYHPQIKKSKNVKNINN